MPTDNERIAEFLDPERKQRRWWGRGDQCPKCKVIHPSVGTWFCVACGHSQKCADRFPVAERCTPPNFTNDLACFTHLRGPLLAMGCCIGDSPCVGTAVWLSDTGPEITDNASIYSYAAAVSAAFLWAMDNQGEALRRACEEVDRGL